MNLGFVCSSLTVTTEKANACSPWSSCLTRKLFKKKIKNNVALFKKRIKNVALFKKRIKCIKQRGTNANKIMF